MKWLAALALTGCSQIFGLKAPEVVSGDAGRDGSASVDSPADTPPGTVCYGAAPFVECVFPPPTAMVVLGATINTDTDCDLVERQSDGSNRCVKLGKSISITAPMHGVGSRPLVLAAETITISSGGILDVSSSTGTLGAGANAASCPATGGASSGMGGGGGGAGGSFGGMGGAGGAGGAGSSITPPGPVAPPSVLVGGCPGGDGGDGGGGLAAHGNGGGAIALLADSITIDGGVFANGGGGSGGHHPEGGGAGGGTGGMIVLAAPAIMLGTAYIIANGGGGGGGATTNADGTAGSTPPSAKAAAAGGGAGGPAAGAGGNGGCDGINATDGIGQTTTGGGAGGGGGAVGFVRVPSGQTLPLGGISPPPS